MEQMKNHDGPERWMEKMKTRNGRQRWMEKMKTRDGRERWIEKMKTRDGRARAQALSVNLFASPETSETGQRRRRLSDTGTM